MYILVINTVLSHLSHGQTALMNVEVLHNRELGCNYLVEVTLGKCFHYFNANCIAELSQL